MIVSAAGEELVNAEEDIFSDVKGDEWFAPFVATAKNLEWMEGYEDGSFGPGKSITRAEATKTLLFAAGIRIVKNLSSSFSDVVDGDWYYGVVVTAANRLMVAMATIPLRVAVAPVTRFSAVLATTASRAPAVATRSTAVTVTIR